MELLLSLLPSVATLVVTLVVLGVVRAWLERADGPLLENTVRTQVILLALTAVGALALILALPIGDARRGQVLSLLGILASAAIALSSTTFLGNAMAGVMLRAVRSFKTGDFVRCGAHFGRVSGRGLFHIEIQTEDRDLTTLPNLYLVTHPVTTVRASGTVISATVSLGYDVPRGAVQKRLLEAAESVELEASFVQVHELGDFSIVYRVGGTLTDVKQLVSTRSRLRGAVLDSLHDAGIEIVSPTVMATRALDPRAALVPDTSTHAHLRHEGSGHDDLVFDKADAAESIEALQDRHTELTSELEAAKRGVAKAPKGPKREQAEREATALSKRLEQLEAEVRRRRDEVED